MKLCIVCILLLTSLCSGRVEAKSKTMGIEFNNCFWTSGLAESAAILREQGLTWYMMRDVIDTIWENRKHESVLSVEDFRYLMYFGYSLDEFTSEKVREVAWSFCVTYGVHWSRTLVRNRSSLLREKFSR